jgi:hypothetical protein
MPLTATAGGVLRLAGPPPIPRQTIVLVFAFD